MKIAKIDEEVKANFDKQKETLTENITLQKRELAELKGHIQKVQHTTHHIEQHTAGGACSGTEVFTFNQYSRNKCSYIHVNSAPFYSHCYGYKFRLMIRYYGLDIGAKLYLMKGEYDDKLPWPVEVKVQLKLLNQAGDHHHVVRNREIKWRKDERDKKRDIDDSLMTYPDLEKRDDGVQYMMNDCLKFRIRVTVV